MNFSDFVVALALCVSLAACGESDETTEAGRNFALDLSVKSGGQAVTTVPPDASDLELQVTCVAPKGYWTISLSSEVVEFTSSATRTATSVPCESNGVAPVQISVPIRVTGGSSGLVRGTLGNATGSVVVEVSPRSVSLCFADSDGGCLSPPVTNPVADASAGETDAESVIPLPPLDNALRAPSTGFLRVTVMPPPPISSTLPGYVGCEPDALLGFEKSDSGLPFAFGPGDATSVLPLKLSTPGKLVCHAGLQGEPPVSSSVDVAPPVSRVHRVVSLGLGPSGARNAVRICSTATDGKIAVTVSGGNLTPVGAIPIGPATGEECPTSYGGMAELVWQGSDGVVLWTLVHDGTQTVTTQIVRMLGIPVQLRVELAAPVVWNVADGQAVALVALRFTASDSAQQPAAEWKALPGATIQVKSVAGVTVDSPLTTSSMGTAALAVQAPVVLGNANLAFAVPGAGLDAVLELPLPPVPDGGAGPDGGIADASAE